jgi:hypothetical protein
MCKHRTEVYSRVVGYYRPVQQWNKGKQAEYADRVPFKLASMTGPKFAPRAAEGAIPSAAVSVGYHQPSV